LDSFLALSIRQLFIDYKHYYNNEKAIYRGKAIICGFINLLMIVQSFGEVVEYLISSIHLNRKYIYFELLFQDYHWDNDLVLSNVLQ